MGGESKTVMNDSQFFNLVTEKLDALKPKFEKVERENAEMRKAIQAAYDALKADALWAFNEANPPNELTAKWADGSASMTHGPHNCRDFFELRKKALEMLEKVLANQLATPSE